MLSCRFLKRPILTDLRKFFMYILMPLNCMFARVRKEEVLGYQLALSILLSIARVHTFMVKWNLRGHE